MLLPFLFQQLDRAYDQLMSSHKPGMNLNLLGKFLATVSASVLFIKVIGASEMHRVGSIEDFLLAYINRRSPSEALLSHNCISHLASNTFTSPELRSGIIFKALRCAQIALVVSPGHEDRGWVPLAGSLSCVIVTKGESMKPTFLAFQKALRKQCLKDLAKCTMRVDNPIIIREVASVIALYASQTGIRNKQRVPACQKILEREEAINAFLNASAVDPSEFTAFLKRVALEEARETDIFNEVIHRFSYLVNAGFFKKR